MCRLLGAVSRRLLDRQQVPAAAPQIVDVLIAAWMQPSHALEGVELEEAVAHGGRFIEAPLQAVEAQHVVDQRRDIMDRLDVRVAGLPIGAALRRDEVPADRDLIRIEPEIVARKERGGGAGEELRLIDGRTAFSSNASQRIPVAALSPVIQPGMPRQISTSSTHLPGWQEKITH